MGRAKPGKANNLSPDQREQLKAFLDPDQTEHLKKIRTENMTIDSAAAYCTRMLDFGAVVTPSNYRNALRQLKRVHKDRKDEWGNITVIQQFTEIEKRALGNKDKFRKAVNQYNLTCIVIGLILGQLPYQLKTKYKMYLVPDYDKVEFLNCMNSLSDVALEFWNKIVADGKEVGREIHPVMIDHGRRLDSIRNNIPYESITRGQSKKHSQQEVANRKFKEKTQFKI